MAQLNCAEDDERKMAALAESDPRAERRGKVYIDPTGLAVLLGFPNAEVIRLKVNEDPFSLEVTLKSPEFRRVWREAESHIVGGVGPTGKVTKFV